MIRRPPRSTQGVSSAASDVYKRQGFRTRTGHRIAAVYRTLAGHRTAAVCRDRAVHWTAAAYRTLAVHRIAAAYRIRAVHRIAAAAGTRTEPEILPEQAVLRRQEVWTHQRTERMPKEAAQPVCTGGTGWIWPI